MTLEKLELSWAKEELLKMVQVPNDLLLGAIFL